MTLMKGGATNVKPLRAVDHRRWIYCRLMKLDPGLAERGFDRHFFLLLVSQVIMLVCPLASIFMAVDSKLRLDNCRCFLLETMATMTLYNEYSSRLSLARFYNYMNAFMNYPQARTVEGRQILEEATKRSHDILLLLFRMFTLSFFVIVISQPLSEVIQGNSWKKLPYQWLFPPTNTELSFWIVFMYQVPRFLISHYIAVVFMSFTSISVQMTALFDVLLLSIRNLEKRAIVDFKESSSPNYRSSLLTCLRNDIALHRELFKEMISMVPYFRNIFFTHTVAISLIMACEAYPIVTGNFTGGILVKSLSALFVEVLCWAQLCIKLETMADKNTEVFDALYETPWYSAGVKYKKLLLTALTNSKNPIYIRSWVFADMNATVATFYSFILSAFNLLNVIRKLK